MNTGANKPKIIVICGPTAVGKTSAAIDFARIFNGEIISADSRQIYRYMNIGTAKPTPEQIAEIPHYLVDFIDPDQHFDARTICSYGS
jgi:tRNA dimethylallyltransferase